MIRKSYILLRNLMWAATLGLWISLFIATHLPARKLPPMHVSDKFLHFTAYFFLAGMIYLSTWLTNPARRWAGATVLAVLVVYGAIDELLQPLVNRHADVRDWLADVGGAASALVLLMMVRWVVGWRQRSCPAAASRESCADETKGVVDPMADQAWGAIPPRGEL